MLTLLLRPHDFNDEVVCLGAQIASVLDALTVLPNVSAASWYAASIDATGNREIRDALRPYEVDQPFQIKDLPNFVSLVRCAVQLLDGVIFCVPQGETPLVAAMLMTACGPIEKLVENAIVQVCAFDTSSIEIGTDSPEIIRHMQLRFGGTIEENTAND